MKNPQLEKEIALLFERLESLSENKRKRDITQFVLSSIEEQVANNKFFYSDDQKNVNMRRQYKELMFNRLNTEYEEIFDLVSTEVESPFSVFLGVFNQDIPDMLISNNMIKIQYNKEEFTDIKVPVEIRDIFSSFLIHLINQQKYINEKKFDMGKGNAIQDIAFERFRMNFVHQSLSVFNSPLITIRKHVTNVDSFKEVEAQKFDRVAYQNSLGVDDKVIEKMLEASMGSFIVFGDTGSGKTTLLRYLIQNRIEEKRNIAIIEDTAELFIDTSISLITNQNYNIHDLFVAALRQNPSHLIIGETRTDEIVDILEAALIFPVSTTIHAKSFEGAVERIYRMSAPRKISKVDIFDIISASIDMFIYMKNRKIAGIWLRNDKRGKPIYDLYDKIY